MSEQPIPKHYDAAESEEKWRRFWEEQGIYRYDPESTKPVYSVDTPPPYVSAAHLHVGHVMSYTQAEFVVRYRRMCGFEVFYPMGFDDNGLPTERFVEKKHKVHKSKISRPDFVKLCLEETRLGAETYKTLWKALGLSVDWSLLYSTINERCRRIAQRSFLDLYGQGRIQRRNDPFMWCVRCQTAVAQADLENLDRRSTLHDVLFTGADGTRLVISTTRPELIPACVALYVHPEDERHKALQGTEAVAPIFGQRVPIRTDPSVDPEFGTGLMMVCTWGDSEDIRKWRDHTLDTRVVIEKDGRMTEEAGELIGLKIPAARERVVELLKEQELLIESREIEQNVNVHERCETPIEFFSAPQWFIGIMDLKEEFLQRGNEVRWYPDFMKARYEDWVRNLKWDWCISRQRYYGVPFPVWFCGDCSEVILATEESLPVDPTSDSPPKDRCSSCGSENIVPEPDVMDTWMTSSLTPLINARWRDDDDLSERVYPMTLRPQAFEIIRTWLFYTIVKSHLHTESLPWRDVMISGWGLDQKGKRISKRLGNYKDPMEIIAKYSADAVRFWSAGSTLGNNLRYVESDVAGGKKTVTKLWNAAKFVFSNLDDVERYRRLPAMEELYPTDVWILSELQKTIESSTEAFESYEYSKVRDHLERFFWQTLCDNYLEFVKMRLRSETEEDPERRSALCTLYHVLWTFLRLLAPLMPYITEELYQRFLKEHEEPISIHTASWPVVDEKLRTESTETGEVILDVAEVVRRFKTENKMHTYAAVSRVRVDGAPEHIEKLKAVRPDLVSATRAGEVLFESAGEAMKSARFGLTVSVEQDA